MEFRAVVPNIPTLSYSPRSSIISPIKVHTSLSGLQSLENRNDSDINRKKVTDEILIEALYSEKALIFF